MQLIGFILLIASSWYLWKLTSNFLDDKTKIEISEKLKSMKGDFDKTSQQFSKEKLKEAWDKYKKEGGALSKRRDKE